jgi:hypothetical protein
VHILVRLSVHVTRVISSFSRHLGVFVHCECQQCSQVAGVRLWIPQQLAARNRYLPLQLFTTFFCVLKLLCKCPVYCSRIVFRQAQQSTAEYVEKAEGGKVGAPYASRITAHLKVCLDV